MDGKDGRGVVDCPSDEWENQATVGSFFSVVFSGDSAVRLKDGGESVPRRKAAWLNSLQELIAEIGSRPLFPMCGC